MNRGLSQEGLKRIACLTMLIDHIGAILVMGLLQSAYDLPNRGGMIDLYEAMRIIGRLAFPIYCFLLVEGSCHTRNPKKYALRLAVAAILSELPYDLAFYGGWTLEHQSVMITLLLGFCALEGMKKCRRQWLKPLVSVPFMLLAGWLHTDYGFNGVLLIAVFALTRELPHRWLWHALGIWFVFSPGHAMLVNWIGGIFVTTQEWAVLAVIPIALYSGEKQSRSKALQWAFYLFYPVHLFILWLI